jgi:hypothetical protein
MTTRLGSHANNVNEIIVSDEFNAAGVDENIIVVNNMNNMNNMNNKKVEKNEKRERSSKSKLIIQPQSNFEIETEEKDEANTQPSCFNRKYIDKIKIVKKPEEFSMNNYSTLLVSKYKMDELKKICTKYKIPKSGNKEDLTKRIYDYCKNSIGPLKIQKVFRGFLQRRLHKIQGPALKNRIICNNDMDFFTMDDMSDIQTTQFYSYRDVDTFIYGFNIVSLYNLILKEGSRAKNPYNRNEFDNKVKENVTNMIRISKVLKIPLEIEIKNDVMDPIKRMELKILELFQTMNSYGNYANSEWFSDLTRNSHIRFARELVDIWNYRALLTTAKKQEICPPHGNPFLGTPYFTNVVNNATLNNLSIETLVRFNVLIIENLVKSAIDIDNKMLGTFYVLSSLTLVSQPARDAMPWLYDAVVYIP